jgi:hypothetical protein
MVRDRRKKYIVIAVTVVEVLVVAMIVLFLVGSRW